MNEHDESEAAGGTEEFRRSARVLDAGPDDRELARRACGGDRDAFGELVQRHQRAAFGVCHRILGDAEQAEDAAQEAFLRAFRALDRFDAERAFRPWLLRIASNAAMDVARRRRGDVSLDGMVDGGESLALAPAGTERIAARELLARVREALPRLTPQARAAFGLRYEEGLSLEEIAEVLGTTSGTLAVTLHRARMRLREIVLGEHDETARRKST